MPILLEKSGPTSLRTEPSEEERETDRLRVQVLTRARDLELFRKDWQALHERSPSADLFNSYEWVTSWLDAFWRDRPISMRLVWEGTRLAGIVPMVLDVKGELWRRGYLVTPVNPHTTRCDVLTDVPATTLWDALLRKHALAGARPIALKRLPADSSTLTGLRNACDSGGHRLHVREELPSPTVATDTDWQTYLAGLSKRARGEIRRKRRRLERAGDMTVRMYALPEEMCAAVRDVLAVEAESWKEEVGTSLLSEPGADRFYPTLMRRCSAAGRLRVYVLYLDGRPLAHVVCTVERRALYALKTSFSQEAADLSPGAVLIGWMLEDATARGEETVDLLGAECAWKAQFATGRRETCSACVVPSGAVRGRLHHLLDKRVKPFLRSHASVILKLLGG